jgi:hypothetical protein
MIQPTPQFPTPLHEQAAQVACNFFQLHASEKRLGLPELYRLLPGVISVRNIEGDELIDKANNLQNLLQGWVVE